MRPATPPHPYSSPAERRELDRAAAETTAILRSVSIFARTPQHILADIAALLEPVEVHAGETIVRKGDPGDCLYIIIEGRVRVHDEDHTLNFLEPHNVFGEMAVLDSAPRVASVTALEDTRLFRLDQAPFYQLMADRSEVALGVLQVLCGHLRARVQDLAQNFHYMREIARLTTAAAALEAGAFEPSILDEVTKRPDELGHLARVFRHMAGEMQVREQRLKHEMLQLRIEIDETKTLEPRTFDLLPPFDFLTTSEKEWLAERASSVAYRPGHTICAPADQDFDRLYLLMEGRVAVREAHGDGAPRVLFEAPAYFGERSIFFVQPPAMSFVADDLVHCFIVPGADVRSLVRTNPTFSRAFGAAFRHKHRIFSGYDAFLNLLFAHADGGTMLLGDLAGGYLGLRSILHQAALSSTLDLDGLGYALPRLPDNITTTSTLLLAEELPVMYRSVGEHIRLSSQRARKRKFYEVLPGKTLAVLRDRMTDTVDLVTKLCIYSMETGKLRKRLASSPVVPRLAQYALVGGTPTEAREIETALPLSPQELAGLRTFFGSSLLARLYEVLNQSGDLLISFPPPAHGFATSSVERWLTRIRQALAKLITPEEFADNLEVHVISSNTHSVKNCLSAWLHEHAASILAWADGAEVAATSSRRADQLYAAHHRWAASHPEQASERAAWEYANGIHTIADDQATGIEVTLIDANRLQPPIDADLGPLSFRQRTLIVNIDYAYGQQAEVILRSLILLFGQRIRSISIIGKSGAVVGQRGDLLLPDQLLFQTTDELYPVFNRDLQPADFEAVGWDRPVHSGTLLTVLGTVMQSREMLLYYRHFWNVVGMEMEGAFYLREILRARSLRLIPEETQLRFAYYVSDTPLDPGASLASALLTEEGVPPVYAVTRAVLRRILLAAAVVEKVTA